MHYRKNYSVYPESFKRCVYPHSLVMLLSVEHLTDHPRTNVVYLFCYVQPTYVYVYAFTRTITVPNRYINIPRTGCVPLRNVNITWDSNVLRTIQKRTINTHAVCISHVLRFVVGTVLLLPGKVHGITVVLASRYTQD